MEIADTLECDWDVVFIGTGPGATSALDALLEEGIDKKICIIEGGVFYENWLSENVINTGRSFGEGKTRAFGLGGSSQLWHGVSAPLDNVDVDSKWPISFDELYKYKTETCALLGLSAAEDFLFSSERFSAGKGLSLKSSDDFVLKPFTFAAKPVRFESFYNKRSSLFKVITNTVVTDILIYKTNQNDELYSLVAQTCNGPRIINTRSVVCAAGALSTPMILFSTRFDGGSGLSGFLPMIGVGLGDHPMCSFGQLRLRKPYANAIVTDFRKDSLNYRIGFNPVNSGAFKNHNIYIRPSVRADGHAGPLNRLIKLLAVKSKFELGFAVAKELFSDPRLLSFIYKNKISPYPQSFDTADLFCVLEQSFSPTSCVKRREDGKFLINWHICEEDIREYKRFFGFCGQYFSDALDAEFVPFTAADDEELRFLKSAAHHTGTARMGKSASDGVVDSDGRVFGTKNLYVADASIIPFSGNANTTLTIVAHGQRCGRVVRKAIE